MTGMNWGVQAAGGVLRVDVRGVPRPQPRARGVGGGGRVHAVSTTGRAAGWKRQVLAAVLDAIEATGWECVPKGPVRLRVVTRFPTKVRARWWTLVCIPNKGDFDNLAKLVSDALTQRGVWGDDCQVAVVEQVQVWVPEQHAGASVEVQALQDGQVLEWAREAWSVDGGVDGGGAAPDWL